MDPYKNSVYARVAFAYFLGSRAAAALFLYRLCGSGC
jgi:hypothetical protein